MIPFLLDNWIALTGVIGSVITFFTGWKFRTINVKKEGASALESIQKVYDTFSTQTNKKFDELYTEIKSLKEENLQQRKSIRELQKDNRDLHREVSKLMQKNNQLLLENQRLKLEKTTPSG